MRRPFTPLLLALALGAAACSSADDQAPRVDVDASSASDAPSASTPPTSGEADENAADDAPAPDAAGDAGDDPTIAPTESTAPSSTPTAATSSEPVPASSAPSSPGSETTLRPVEAGTYTYATKGSSKLGENPREDLPTRTTLEVTAAGSDDIQEQTRDTRDEDGYGSRNTTTLKYGVEGAVLLRSDLETTVDVFGSPFTQQTRLEADPPVVIARHGGDVGFHADLKLVGDEVTVTGTLDVVARETVTIAGAPVDTFRVEVRYVLTGSIEGISEATWWVRPEDLLVVKEETMTDVTSRGLRYQEEYTAQLTGLGPR